VIRQENLKILAAQADQRWNEKASVLDAPGNVMGQPLPTLGVGMAQGETSDGAMKGKSGSTGGVTSIVDDTTEPESVGNQARESTLQPETTRESKKSEDEKEDPWKKAQGGPSEQWQPQAWTGGRAATRRG
jgi:NADH dehydrogenase [ubiquinone] 1 alpha subcomplex assembly factor 2